LKAGVTRMLDGFESAEIETGETTIFARRVARVRPSCCCTSFPRRCPASVRRRWKDFPTHEPNLRLRTRPALALML
jgi:hypothetical protein